MTMSLSCYSTGRPHAVRTGLRLAIAFVATSAIVAHAQTFPSRPVRIVVPFPAGGSFDVTARVLAQRMRTSLGQNATWSESSWQWHGDRPVYVARQPADGYTMLMIGPSFTSHADLRSGLAFDTDRDFRAVSQVIGLTMGISVNPSLPVKNMKS